MKKLLVLFVTLAASPALAAPPAFAHTPERTRIEISTTVGALIPRDDQRDLFRSQFLFGLNMSYDLNDYFAVVASLGVTAEKMLGQRIEKPRSTRLDRLYQYDLGVRAQKPFDLGTHLVMRPFVGVGLGARSYTFKNAGPADETFLAGYGTAGVSFEYRRIALALGARAYLSAFSSSDSRNDIAVFRRVDGSDRWNDSDPRNDIAVFETIGVRF